MSERAEQAVGGCPEEEIRENNFLGRIPIDVEGSPART